MRAEQVPLRLQGRNPFDFLVEAIACHAQGRPMPSLVPDKAGPA